MMDLLSATLVEKIDQMGKGVELIEELGQDKFKELMDSVRRHEAKR